MTQQEKAEQFRALHEAGCFVIANAWDAGSARILARQGFQALATTSAGLAFMLGRRDGEAAVSRHEALSNAGDIAAATELPVSADLEDGYGPAPEACAATVTAAGMAGLCGCTIEDTTGTAASPLHGFDEAVARVRAAVAAARALPSPFVLTARGELPARPPRPRRHDPPADRFRGSGRGLSVRPRPARHGRDPKSGRSRGSPSGQRPQRTASRSAAARRVGRIGRAAGERGRSVGARRVRAAAHARAGTRGRRPARRLGRRPITCGDQRRDAETRGGIVARAEAIRALHQQDDNGATLLQKRRPIDPALPWGRRWRPSARATPGRCCESPASRGGAVERDLAHAEHRRQHRSDHIAVSNAAVGGSAARSGCAESSVNETRGAGIAPDAALALDWTTGAGSWW